MNSIEKQNNMETTVYDVDYFIKKFEAIPDSEIGVLSLDNKCALLYCGARVSSRGNYILTKESAALVKILAPISPKTSDPGSTVWNINDGNHYGYKQRTPKQRILAALYDIKKAQQPEVPTSSEVREKVVYVTVDAAVRELQEEKSIHQN
jgi:hypothetical protein